MNYNKCPICKHELINGKEVICTKCGWDMNYYTHGMSEREENIFLIKKRIALRNWKALVKAVKQAKFLKQKIESIYKDVKLMENKNTKKNIPANASQKKNNKLNLKKPDEELPSHLKKKIKQK